MSKAYRLYDEGINARMRGDLNQAVGKLTESWKLFNDMRCYQITGELSQLEALVHYELGQAAEALGDQLTAKDSYARCLLIRPTLVEASVRLVNMLAASGQWQLALAKAQDAVRGNPLDPRAHMIFSLVLSRTGHPEEARQSSQKAQELLNLIPDYKPMGIDAAWRKQHGEGHKLFDRSGGDIESDAEPAKSDVDNPEDVMGDMDGEEE